MKCHQEATAIVHGRMDDNMNSTCGVNYLTRAGDINVQFDRDYRVRCYYLCFSREGKGKSLLSLPPSVRPRRPSFAFSSEVAYILVHREGGVCFLSPRGCLAEACFLFRRGVAIWFEYRPVRNGSRVRISLHCAA